MIGPILASIIVLSGACIATPTATSPKYDTIVVGLGSAGTTAASTLARAGRRVLALEAQGRVGGRVRTEPFSDGVVELGAEWIHGQSPSRVHDLAVQNDVPLLTQDLPLQVLRSDGSGPDDTLTELFHYCWGVIDGGSDRPESVGELVERKLREHLAETNPDLLKDEKRVERILEMMSLAVNSLEASSSFREVAVQSGYKELNGSLYGTWHRYGYKTFFEILLNKYNDGPGLPSLDIELNQEVTNIEWGAGGVAVTCAGGARYSADSVIVTVSLGVLKERHAALFSPPLPQEKVTAIETISMGLLDKVVLQFDQPLDGWRNWTMFFWSADDVSSLPEGDRWLSKFSGSSRPAGCNNTLTLWIAGDIAKLEESLPDDVVRTKVVELLQRFSHRDVTVPPPVAMLRSTWFTNPFTRGSYTFTDVKTGEGPGLRAALAEPLSAGGAPRVLFAGEATSADHYGTVHGASETGYREAQRLLAH